MTNVFLRYAGSPRLSAPELLADALRYLGLQEAVLCHDGAGRPYLSQGPAISISHSRSVAAVAVSNGPVGVDVEEPRRISAHVPRRVLSPEEFRWYQSRGEQAADFLTLWTLKESRGKYFGTGLRGYPNDTVFLLENGCWRLRGAEQRFHVWNLDLVSVALCCDDPEAGVIWLPER